MRREDNIYQMYLHILKEELIMAMGCTEPVAISYAAAKAREILGELPDRVVVRASGSIIKNVKSVIVPHTNGMKGIEAAAGAGILYGKVDRKLEVLSAAKKEEIQALPAYLRQTDIRVTHMEEGHSFDLTVAVYKNDKQASVRITDYHTNIVVVRQIKRGVNPQIILAP